jgi:hypothetical protein
VTKLPNVAPTKKHSGITASTSVRFSLMGVAGMDCVTSNEVMQKVLHYRRLDFLRALKSKAHHVN